MTLLNERGVTLTLVAGRILAGLQGCIVTTTDEIVARELARIEAGIWVYGSEERVPHLCYAALFGHDPIDPVVSLALFN